MNALDHALQPLAGLRLARLPRATRLCLEMLDRLDGGAARYILGRDAPKEFEPK